MTMFDTELCNIVYSKYLNGVPLWNITDYVVFHTEYHAIRHHDVEQIIDNMNLFHL